MTDAPDPRRTLVVMLGASVHPLNPEFDNPRFKQSAEDLRAYFVDTERFGLPEANLLWRFDSPASTNQLNDEIEAFLRAAATRPEGSKPCDVIVSFIGHGFHDDRKRYHLATRSYKPNSPEYSYPFQLLQRTVKEQMRFARKYYVLDACYSASAAGEMMEMAGETVASKVLTEAQQQTKEDAPKRGTVVLCAAAKDEKALAPNAEAHTMFTGALLTVLESAEHDGQVFSLHQLYGAVSGEITSKFQTNGVLPELHVPDQKQGDVGELPLFPVRRKSAAAEASGLFDALHPATFAGDGQLHAVVVGRQRQRGQQLSDLQQAVIKAWSTFGSQIVAAVDRCRAAWRAPLVPTGEANGGLVLAELCIERACTSKEALQRAVAALCRAEIAIFDLTDWDPVATFLLGVRAVARRGVTITIRSGRETAIPFNLQLLNMAELSKGEGKRSSELIGSKIVNGFGELLNLPHYLDLPAYDSVRQLGIDSSAYRPIKMAESVLVLCPFSLVYTETNFDLLETLLPPRVKEHVQKDENRAAGQPALVRLLNLKTPRLVAQTLFESIRLIDMCVIDWTGGNTNVIFEAGVRMAINPLGAVHIIEEGTYDTLRKSAASGTLLGLLRLMEPTVYRLAGFDITAPFERMVQRFEASVEANGRRETNFVYEAVGRAIDRRSQPAALPLVTELARSANLLDTEDWEGGGISPVLFHDVNAELAREARDAAADRRLAAWLFISRRYEPNEIAAAPELLDGFELLSFQVKRWARRSKHTKVLDEVRTKLDDVRKAASTVAPADPLDDERQAIRLIARAKRDKEEAKDLRDAKDVQGAVDLLTQTVTVLSASKLASGLEKAADPTRLEKDLAAQLADCYGMLGGNYRRLGQLDEAYANFRKGVVYEESEALEVMSSYNLVNCIVMPIENQSLDPDAQRSRIQAAVAAITRQVRGQRRSDRWAWADLAQCQLLLGERDPALQSYARVRDLGDEATAGSIVPVLERLAGVVPSRAKAIKAAIAAFSGGEAAAAEGSV